MTRCLLAPTPPIFFLVQCERYISDFFFSVDINRTWWLAFGYLFRMAINICAVVMSFPCDSSIGIEAELLVDSRQLITTVAERRDAAEQKTNKPKKTTPLRL